MKIGRLNRFFEQVAILANRPWFVALSAFLALMDAFVFIIPVEALLVPAAMVRKKTWFWAAIWISLGSAAGAAAFGWVVGVYGSQVIEHLLPGALASRAWLQTDDFMHRYGAWSLSVFSVGVLPQHLAVSVAGLAQISSITIFMAVFLGRIVKYGFIAWCAVSAPKVLKKLGILA